MSLYEKIPTDAGARSYCIVMRPKSSLSFITLLALLGLGGCDLIVSSGDAANSPLSKEAITARDAASEDVFKGVLAGESMYLLQHNCEV